MVEAGGAVQECEPFGQEGRKAPFRLDSTGGSRVPRPFRPPFPPLRRKSFGDRLHDKNRRAPRCCLEEFAGQSVPDVWRKFVEREARNDGGAARQAERA